MNILNWFTGFGRAIHDGFARLFGANAASTLLAAQKQIFSSAIGSFALEVVTDLAGMDIASSAKWEIAGTKIAAKAAELGIQIAKSEINLLIELAYSAVQHKTA